MGEVKRSFLEYWKGSKAYAVLVSMKAKGRKVFVSKKVADERAAICSVCQFNQPIQGITAKGADSIMLKQVDGRTTSHDNKLQNCDACSCPLKLAVHLSEDVLRKTKDRNHISTRIKKRQQETGKVIHKDCWQAKLLNIEP